MLAAKLQSISDLYANHRSIKRPLHARSLRLSLLSHRSHLLRELCAAALGDLKYSNHLAARGDCAFISSEFFALRERCATTWHALLGHGGKEEGAQEKPLSFLSLEALEAILACYAPWPLRQRGQRASKKFEASS